MSNKILKILKLIFFILIILLIIVIFFLFKKISNNKTIRKESRSSFIKEYKIDNIELLTFDFKNVEVNYLSTNNNKLVIKQSGKSNNYLVHETRTSNKLNIKEISTNIFVKTSYKIYIPKTYINKINIINGFNNIKIDNMNNDLVVDNNSGNVTIGKTNNITVKNVSGNIIIKMTNTASITSTTGDIVIDNLLNSANIDTITGDITINRFYLKNDSYLESTSGNIYIKLNKDSMCKLNVNSEVSDISKRVCLEGNNLLTVNNTTGEVQIK